MKIFDLMLKFCFFCFLLVSNMGCTSNQSENDGRAMIFPMDLNIIQISNSVKFDTSWFKSKYKVAVFIKKAGAHSTMDLDWQSAISKNKAVAFLFYVSENDSSKLIKHMKEVNFLHPVIHDPNFEFRKLNLEEDNLSFISFLVMDDKIVEMSNPSFPDFQERLDSLTKTAHTK